MREIKNISITPKPDCRTCTGSGVMKAGLAPTPFGPGSVSLPEEWCHCVIGQLPDDDGAEDYDCNIVLEFPESEKKAEEWEIIIGAKYVHIWEAGRFSIMEYFNAENGQVCDIELLPAPSLAKSIELAMPRAHLISRAPAMLRLLEKLYPLIEAEAENRTPPSPKYDGKYWTEFREALNEISAEIDRAHGRKVAEPEHFDHDHEDAEPEPEPDNDDYDYAADDRNFDAARERSMKR